MERLNRASGYINQWYKKAWAQWLVALLFFFSVSWFYMGSAITSCNAVTIAPNSDTSGGLAWFQWVDGNDPTWDFSNKSNYPVGESLARPQRITSAASSLTYWGLAKATSPTCGVNLLVLGGFLTTALLSFGLVRWLIRRNDIALLSGYAAAYAPYYQLKANSHVTYMYGSLFTLILWSYLYFVQKPSYKKAALFGGATIFSMYFDGYFVLISGALVGMLLLALLFKRVFSIASSRKDISIKINYREVIDNFKKYYKYILLLAITAIIFLAPVLYTQFSRSSDIKSDLGVARNDINFDTFVYSIRPYEFFLPSDANPLMPEGYKAWRSRHMHMSNPNENTVYLGLVTVALSLIGFFIYVRKKERIVKFESGFTYGYIYGLLLFVILGCVLLSLPPKLEVFGLQFITPTQVLIKFTANWRVLARFFLVIHQLIVVLAAISLYMILRRVKVDWKKTLVVGILLVIVFLEYFHLPIHSGLNIYSGSPQLYRKIKDDSSVNVIAEYPITELGHVPIVFSMQQVHGKKTINANDSGIARSPLNLSTEGLADLQTLCVLKSRGVDLVTSFNKPIEGVKGLVEYLPSDGRVSGGLPPIYSYKLNLDKGCPFALVTEKGFGVPEVGNNNKSSRTLLDGGNITVLESASGKPANGKFKAGLTAKSLNSSEAKVTIYQRGEIIWSGIIPRDGLQRINFNTNGSDEINIKTSSPISIFDLSAMDY